MHDRERKWQERWRKEQVFEANPDNREKFFCTFPYPYVNGLPHVGHLFSIMRVEALARYQRLNGRNVLFPQGFHATGSPIATAAMRVAEKDEKQIGILKNLGVKDSEIEAFEDPEFWIEYFVPRYREDLQKVGLSIDWRRQFTTTSLNPQYDAFIRWQFQTLREKGYVVQGEHPVVWCPKENCPVSDHARSQGEGETPQEFLLVKHKLSDGRFIVSATLRPDTILGITNLFVNPSTEYALATINGEEWILARRAAERLMGQGRQVSIIGTIAGRDLIGKETEELDGHVVPILPATFVDPNFGTGLVHSVPSDSADDLIALRDLQNNDEGLAKYGLDPEKVRSIEPIAVLDTQGIGGTPAQHFIEEYGVKHQNEKKKLDEIRQKLYKLSFYAARFNEKYSDFFSRNIEGKPVQDEKDFVQEEIIRMGWGDTYYQLTGKVVCRCQTEAVVKIVDDQWFITYSNQEWKGQVHEHLENMLFHPPVVKQQFSHVVDWLNDWACTREYGLGTRLPWDERWLIESLSDSTIYMAYYTIAHRIEDMPAEYLTREFFDYVFLGKGKKPEVPGLDPDEVRQEFLYWYPMDFRNSGKDLVQNHLTFMLFNHAAIFPKELWPKAIGVNGWVTVNGQKMSKSLGNVIPIRQLVDEYGADATRITILNGGEGLDDPNWDSDFARGMMSKLDNLMQQAGDARSLTGEETVMDAWLSSRMNEMIAKMTAAMNETSFRTAIQIAFFEYGSMLRWYEQRTLQDPNGELYREALSNQLILLAPFVPHACEEAWEALGNKGLVCAARWPEGGDIDESLHAVESMVEDLAQQLRRSDKEGGKVNLYLAADWKRDAYRQFDAIAQKTRHPGEITKQLMQTDLREHGDELVRLIKYMVKSRTPGYIPTIAQEREWLSGAKEFLEKESGAQIEILDPGSTQSRMANNGLPARPAVEFTR